VNTAATPVQAVFRVPPRMTKTEVKEYLTKIYELPVAKVHTMNYLGACCVAAACVFVWHAIQAFVACSFLLFAVVGFARMRQFLNLTSNALMDLQCMNG
jgi:hypothetical protein